MSIKGLMLDPVSNSPIVVLKDDEEKFFLPIWVGIFEANAIALQLENVTTPRPMTHDLLRNMISELNARVIRVVINDLRDSTFFAQIRLLTGEKTLELDARPSDAIALALRVEAPIYVAQSVLDQAQTISSDSDDQDEKTQSAASERRDNLGRQLYRQAAFRLHRPCELLHVPGVAQDLAIRSGELRQPRLCEESRFHAVPGGTRRQTVHTGPASWH